MQHGIIPLNEWNILKLKMKHPQAASPEPELLLPDGTPNIHPIRFDSKTSEEDRKPVM